MGLMTRFLDFFRSNVNATLDKMEDPTKMINQFVFEMEDAVSKLTEAVGKAIANRNSLKKKIDNYKETEADWESKAKKALTLGKDDLAKQALLKKQVAVKGRLALEPTFNSADTMSTKLKGQLDDVKIKLEDARNRKGVLIAKMAAAKTQKDLNQAMLGIGDSSFAKLDKWEDKIDEMESEANAYAELSDKDSSLDQQFLELEAGDTDDELFEMKKQMGLLDNQETKQLQETNKET